jgi:WD40 repeat protein
MTLPDGATVTAGAWHPEGHMVAQPEAGRSTIRLVDVASRKIVRTLSGVDASVTHLQFSPDGRFLVAAGAGPTAHAWNTATGERVADLADHADGLLAVAWHPDGDRLATAGHGRVIRLWNTNDWRQVAVLKGHTSYVYSLAFSPDGSYLTSGSGDHTVRVWHTEPPAKRIAASAAHDAPGGP